MHAQSARVNVGDPYQVLGVSTDAGIDEIRRAYRKMVALKWHPDRHVNDKMEATNTFVEANKAYQTLIHELGPSSNTGRPTHYPAKLLPTPKSSVESLIHVDSVSQIFTDTGTRTTPSSSLGGSTKLLRTNCHRSNLPYTSQESVHPYINGVSRHGDLDSTRLPLRTHHPSQEIPYTNRYGSQRYQVPTRTRIKQSSMATPRDILHGPNVVVDPYALKPGPPLQPLGTGPSGEWAYSLSLTLEELFSGKHCQFCIVRNHRSGRKKTVIVEIDVPPGCRRGTRILCRGVGHELHDGTLQNVAFIIEEADHDRFSRIQDDLFLDIEVPWSESLKRYPKEVHFKGLDGEDICVYIDYPRDKMLRGSISIRRAGMPIRDRGFVCGRGNLIVRWKILPSQTRIGRFFERIFHRGTGLSYHV